MADDREARGRELARSLAEPGLEINKRLALLEELCGAVSKPAEFLKQAGVPPFPLPGTKEWLAAPSKVARVLAAGVKLDELKAVLEAGEPADLLAGAFDIAALRAAAERRSARALERLVRGRLRDPRPSGIRAWGRTTLGGAARTAHARLIVSQIPAAGDPPAWLAGAAWACLEAALEEDPPARVGEIIHSWGRAFPAAEAAARLLEALKDRGRPPGVRAAAREALAGLAEAAAGLAAEGDRLAAMILRDGSQAYELRKLLGSAEARLRPESFEKLQAEGIVPAPAVPAASEVAPNTGGAFEELARKVSRGDLEKLLREAPDDAGDRLTAAFRLIGPIAEAAPERALRWEPLLRRLLADRRVLEFSPRGKTYKHSLNVSQGAFAAYCALLEKLPRGMGRLKDLEEELARALGEAAVHCLDRELSGQTLAYKAKELLGTEALEGLARVFLECLGGRGRSSRARLDSWSALRNLGLKDSLEEGTRVMAAALQDPAEDAEFRQTLLELLNQERPGLVKELAAAGKLERKPLPPIEELCGFQCEERGQLYGLQVLESRLKALAATASLEEVLALVEAPADLARALSAVELLAPLLAGHPELGSRAMEALIKLMSDPRIHEGKVRDGKHSQSEKFGLAYAAVLALGRFLPGRSEVERDSLADRCLAAVLSGPGTAHLILSVCALWRPRSGPVGPTLQRLARAVGEAAGNRALPAASRLQVYQALEALEKAWPEIAGAVKLARGAATKALVRALTDPGGEDPEFIRFARRTAPAAAPAEIARLQKKGVLAVGKLPALDGLLGESGAVGDAVLSEASLGVAPGSALAALVGEDTPAALTAMMLAPALARRGRAPDFLSALIPWIASSEHYVVWRPEGPNARLELALRPLRPSLKQPEGAPKGRWVRTIGVASTAAEKAVEVLGLLPADGKEERLLAFRLLDALLEGLPDSDWGLSSQRNSCLGFIKRGDAAAGVIPFLEELWARLKSRDRSAMARFRSWEALRGMLKDRAPAEAWAAAALLDPLERPGLRALLGTEAWRRSPEALREFLDQAVEPWLLKAGARADLPVSVPAKSVPEAWLACAVVMAEDAKTRGEALGALGARYAIKKPEDLEPAREGLRRLFAAAPADFGKVLRRAAETDAEGRGFSAAALLALLGLPEDIDRIAQAAMAGVWIPFPHFGEGWSPTNELMNAYDSDNASEGVYNSLDPYIQAGYGPETDKVRARLFRVLTRRHAEAGRLKRSRLAYAQALEYERRGDEE